MVKKGFLIQEHINGFLFSGFLKPSPIFLFTQNFKDDLKYRRIQSYFIQPLENYEALNQVLVLQRMTQINFQTYFYCSNDYMLFRMKLFFVATVIVVVTVVTVVAGVS